MNREKFMAATIRSIDKEVDSIMDSISHVTEKILPQLDHYDWWLDWHQELHDACNDELRKEFLSNCISRIIDERQKLQDAVDYSNNVLHDQCLHMQWLHKMHVEYYAEELAGLANK